MGVLAAIERGLTRKSLSPVTGSGGWYPLIRESFTGAWQQGVTVDFNTAASFYAVFACTTLIASDIAKLRVMLQGETTPGVWQETTNAAYSPVLRKPNHFQTRIQFWESWMLSKLMRGNTYVLKQRDARGVVTALYVLNPDKVTVLVSDSGDVFYELHQDRLPGLDQNVIVPAREIIHDRMNCLFHPLVGLSPIYACALSATQGHAIQTNASKFFANGARPGGILVAPGKIDSAAADRLKEAFETKFSGENSGRIAVLGDGLKYEALSMTADEAQMIEQLKMTGEVCCSAFHVPLYKVGLGPLPSYNNIQALNVEYYTQALQFLIEAAEVCLDEGLGLSEKLGTAFDLDGLLRMDSITQMTVLKDGVSAGLMSPNEGRAKLGRGPVTGGDSPMIQQQNFSLEALAKRDAKEDPFGKAEAAAPEPPATAENDNAQEVQAAKALASIWKGFA